jgi:hypothetical protein
MILAAILIRDDLDCYSVKIIYGWGHNMITEFNGSLLITTASVLDLLAGSRPTPIAQLVFHDHP